MAKIIPSNALENWRFFAQQMRAGERGEYFTLEYLSKNLPDSLTVFFSVNWSLNAGHKTHAREVDYIIVNNDGKAILVEQKLGTLIETENGLAKTYEGGDYKDVSFQILSSRDGIMTQFNRQHTCSKQLDLDYLLYCPQYRVNNLNAAGLDRDNIIDAPEKERLANILKSRLNSKSSSQTEHAKKVISFFKQTLHIVPDVSSLAVEHNKRFLQLNAGAWEFIDGLKMVPMRLQVCGVAGSGKTLMACQLAQKAINEGKNPLFVCFNNPLKETVQNALPNDVKVSTYHGLIHNFCIRSDVNVDYTPGYKSQAEWNDLLEEVIAASNNDDSVYDCLIVDEGQDLGIEALEFLRLFLTNDHDIYWVEDYRQNLRYRQSQGEEPYDGFTRVDLKRNYRNPASICRVIAKIFPDVDIPGNDLDGLGVGIHRISKSNEQLPLVKSIVENALQKGFKETDIAIVSLKGLSSTDFSKLDSLGPYSIRRFSGKYENDKQVYTKGNLTFETIHRFKGQQAPLVILVDVDPHEDKEHEMAALYCGMTRACVRLEIVTNKKNKVINHIG